MEKILTVVVPVYNMERYLDQCLRSLVPQKNKDALEVLVTMTVPRIPPSGSPGNTRRRFRRFSG